MVVVRRLVVSPTLINSSSPWASERDQLQELFDSPYTGAITTRTATLTGFRETPEHTVALTNESISSVNSYGYSPHPLSTYVDYVNAILSSAPDGSTKRVIISITSSSPISLACEGMTSRIGIELNTSCPNIKDSPPPAYNMSGLTPILDILAQYFWKDPTLVIGLKLPPYIYSTQFDELSRRLNPFAFLTSTNTLGQTLFFAEQVSLPPGKALPASDDVAAPNGFALPTTLGGMAGEALHPLALGNVYTLRQLLDAHHDTSLRDITIIGVGGVTTRAAHARMRRAGAAVVACATILMHEGVSVFEKLSITNEG
ncbi:FMN-linked oxidoreductase [Multifurca ochricompacta]|uniref:Dihydroorotate oxidase n=1 Tax=Multifurca ochricompacta TaxID=376703 RepID=A0AAD4MEP5_9AGAM|nr:FMN-linked oxidoreductase [Multifurca ochricompacta]